MQSKWNQDILRFSRGKMSSSNGSYVLKNTAFVQTVGLCLSDFITKS